MIRRDAAGVATLIPGRSGVKSTTVILAEIPKIISLGLNSVTTLWVQRE